MNSAQKTSKNMHNNTSPPCSKKEEAFAAAAEDLLRQYGYAIPLAWMVGLLSRTLDPQENIVTLKADITRCLQEYNEGVF